MLFIIYIHGVVIIVCVCVCVCVCVQVLQVWDPRSDEKLMRLKGHTDNVRALLLSPDGTTVSFCLTSTVVQCLYTCIMYSQ